ncbi:hypothetical protein [Pararobbsia alpina]|uniref:Uncharacterized protein n=1 Tax=Pararobbsia alpina TaxID=621374 RepID=A0A6S7BBG5_9BURK|nr:hypothetical protein [Pararobbsia alpina]CAB3784417.1 hypothetical protein LMG28138_01805 [Pararobbsia alpina]
MTLDESEQVETLLIEWHRWQSSYFPALGAGRCDPTCREYRSGNQWLDAKERAEIADAKIWKANSEIVEVCVDTLTWQHRAAIQVSMKNKRVGVSVWGNARLSAEESHRLYQEAKDLLFPMLFSRGLIKPEPIVKSVGGSASSAVSMAWRGVHE